MAQEHGHPGQREPQSHGRTHHEDLNIDRYQASVDELAELPMVGKQRAGELAKRRPFRSWDEVE